MFRSIIAVFTALCFLASSACTSMRAIDGSRPDAVRSAVKVGDEVSVSAVNGKTYLLVLTVVDDEKIVGIGDNQKVTIRYGQIKSIEVRKISAAKTAGAIGGGLVALYAALVVTVIILFKVSGDGLGDG